MLTQMECDDCGLVEGEKSSAIVVLCAGNFLQINELFEHETSGVT